MSHNEFQSSEPIKPQEASPMKQEMHVLGSAIAKRMSLNLSQFVEA
jgi:hypothetical protein